MIIPSHIPFFAPLIYPTRVWKMPAYERILYISFDDGPHPEITPRVLDLLKDCDAKATFFCLGKNVKAYPEVYQRILDEGHGVGNHSQDHLCGWSTADDVYVNNVMEAGKWIDSQLFRPPYGKMRSSQARKLSDLGMRTIMWTVLSGDYDEGISKEKCANRVISNITPGNIFLFHDSEKAEKNMLYALDMLLTKGIEGGYGFMGMNSNIV